MSSAILSKLLLANKPLKLSVNIQPSHHRISTCKLFPNLTICVLIWEGSPALSVELGHDKADPGLRLSFLQKKEPSIYDPRIHS